MCVCKAARIVVFVKTHANGLVDFQVFRLLRWRIRSFRLFASCPIHGCMYVMAISHQSNIYLFHCACTQVSQRSHYGKKTEWETWGSGHLRSRKKRWTLSRIYCRQDASSRRIMLRPSKANCLFASTRYTHVGIVFALSAFLSSE